MEQSKTGLPTLEAFARLVENARGEADYPDAIRTLEWLIQENPEAAQLNRELEAVLEDCGTAGLEGAHVEAATAARQFGILLSQTDWEDVNDVLDERPCCESLVRMCEARLINAPGDPVLDEAHRKLHRSLSTWMKREQAEADRWKAEAELADRIFERIKKEMAQQCCCPFLLLSK